LWKLEFNGIRGKANLLIKSYLHNGYQRVIINNKHSNKYFSEWKMVKIAFTLCQKQILT
jgi:hypothetical protein